MVGAAEQFQKDLLLTGRYAIVTGAGRGIGRATALRFARAGAAGVALAARTVSQLEETAAEVRAAGAQAIVVPTDVSQSIQVERLVSQVEKAFPLIDIFVNNAGGGVGPSASNMREITDDMWNQGLAVNLSSCFYAARAMHDVFVRQQHGKFVIISSIYGFRGGRNNFIYCAAKGGLLQLARSLALTWNRVGVQVNAVCPGFVSTDLILPKGTQGSGTAIAGSVVNIPLGYVAQADEIAYWVAFLSSSAADAMTGQVVTVDGGSAAAGFAPKGITFEEALR